MFLSATFFSDVGVDDVASKQRNKTLTWFFRFRGKKPFRWSRPAKKATPAHTDDNQCTLGGPPRERKRERVCVCLCVCVCKRERDRERQREVGKVREIGMEATFGRRRSP